MTLRSYKVELDPNDRQRTGMLRHAGAARFIYNWGLAELRREYRERKTGTAPGEKVRGALTPRDIQARLPALKEQLPWLREVTAQTLQSALWYLDAAFKSFFRRVKSGGPPGYPRFKKKGVTRPSFQFPQKVKVRPAHLQLPKIGGVRMKREGYVPTDLPVKTVTVSERAGRWYASVLIEIPEAPAPSAPLTEEIVGVDLGVKTLAVLSEGTRYPNPRHLERSLGALRKLQRRLSRQKKGSNRRARTKARLARAHARVADQRNDAIHKMTAEVVKTKRPQAVVIEDLNVQGMVKNRHLARAVSGAAFGEVRRQLTYKAERSGVRLIVADRWFPSSKTCSACGAVRDTLGLGERVFRCPACGFIEDRDLNAAQNLRAWGLRVLTGGTPVTARGGAGRPQVTEAGPDETRTDLKPPLGGLVSVGVHESVAQPAELRW